LPFAYNPKFFDEIQTLNPDHIKYLVNAYSLERDKIDDLRIFHPYRFFEVVEKFTSLFEESDHWKRSIENLVGLLTIDNDRFGI
jgi:hypothetical protein